LSPLFSLFLFSWPYTCGFFLFGNCLQIKLLFQKFFNKGWLFSISWSPPPSPLFFGNYHLSPQTSFSLYPFPYKLCAPLFRTLANSLLVPISHPSVYPKLGRFLFCEFCHPHNVASSYTVTTLYLSRNAARGTSAYMLFGFFFSPALQRSRSVRLILGPQQVPPVKQFVPLVWSLLRMLFPVPQSTPSLFFYGPLPSCFFFFVAQCNSVPSSSIGLSFAGYSRSNSFISTPILSPSFLYISSSFVFLIHDSYFLGLCLDLSKKRHLPLGSYILPPKRFPF